MDGDALADEIIEQSLAETAKSISSTENQANEEIAVESTTELLQNDITASEVDVVAELAQENEQSTVAGVSEMELTAETASDLQQVADIPPEIDSLLTDVAEPIQTTSEVATEKEEQATTEEILGEQQMATTEEILGEQQMATTEEILGEQQMEVTDTLVLSDKMVEEDVILTPVEMTNEEQNASLQNQIGNDIIEDFDEKSQTEVSDTIMDKLEQLPDSFNVNADMAEPIAEINATNASQEPTDILQEAAKKIEPNKWKPKSGAFSLGVPGLSFSAQNLKISSDGTKMVQIHQSQITSAQLEALQSNPNIKVVFRHIPSGKSFTKPPKNLFKKKSAPKSAAASPSPVPASVPTENGIEADDSVYNFDEDYEDESPIQEPQTKKLLSNDYNPNRYARYNPNVGFGKKKSGRTKLHESDNVKPVLPAQIQLTDALVKLNKPGALHTIKVHVKQVTHDILINMELDPKYNIVLTAKHEDPPRHSLEELVKEWEEKESEKLQQETPPKQVQKESSKASPAAAQEEDVAMDTTEAVANESQATDATSDKPETSVFATPEPKKPKKDAEEAAKLKELKMKQRAKEEKEESEMLAKSIKETTSRSGRVRKPSRFSLDIARMTKRRAPTDSDSNDSPAPKKSKVSQTPPPPETKPSEAPVRKGRGRPPKKGKKEEKTENSEKDSNDTKQEEKAKEIEQKSPPGTAEPRVLLSPADKRLADKKLFGKKAAEDKESAEKNINDASQSSSPEKSKSTEDAVEKTTPKKSPASPQKKKDTPQKPEEQSSSAAEDCDLPTLTKKKKSPKKQSPVKIKAPAASTKDTETPSDILARKLSKELESSDSEKMDTSTTAIKDFVEEEGDVDNKYRLRKLLQQCSIEEIRSVAMPKALDIISLGDFFTYKAGQMSKKPVSFTALYQQLENFYFSMEKEAMRYSTLLKRANKVGGDRRMEKVILTPVYNKLAADSLQLSNHSVDAHIGGIYQKPTTPMIAANSFHMNCKMDPPLHRLKLPDIADKSHARNKQPQPIPTTSVSNSQAQLNLLYSRQNFGASRSRGTWKKGSFAVRKPDEDAQTLTLQEHARIQAASRYQPLKQAATIADTNVSTATTTVLQAVTKADNEEVKTTVTTEAGELSTTTTGTDASGQVMTETITAEEGATIVQAEDGKQLVSIGDGQYVELPEGYTLIQTDEGYIIGQPGATFVQGEDGNVYMTSAEEGNAEVSDQVLTKTVDLTEGQTTEEQVIDQISQS